MMTTANKGYLKMTTSRILTKNVRSKLAKNSRKCRNEALLTWAYSKLKTNEDPPSDLALCQLRPLAAASWTKISHLVRQSSGQSQPHSMLGMLFRSRMEDGSCQTRYWPNLTSRCHPLQWWPQIEQERP